MKGRAATPPCHGRGRRAASTSSPQQQRVPGRDSQGHCPHLPLFVLLLQLCTSSCQGPDVPTLAPGEQHGWRGKSSRLQCDLSTTSGTTGSGSPKSCTSTLLPKVSNSKLSSLRKGKFFRCQPVKIHSETPLCPHTSPCPERGMSLLYSLLVSWL